MTLKKNCRNTVPATLLKLKQSDALYLWLTKQLFVGLVCPQIVTNAYTIETNSIADLQDNVIILISYFTQQHAVSASDLKQHLGIGEDFEEIC